MPTAQLKFLISDEQQMLALGQRLAVHSQTPLVIYLKGELGAGKTTLVRGFLRGLHYKGLVKSPTYMLVEGYDLGAITVFHFDLYRLNDPQELDFLDLDEYFSAATICLIEWPERGQPFLPAADLRCEVEIIDSGRNVVLTSSSQKGKVLLEKMRH